MGRFFYFKEKNNNFDIQTIYFESQNNYNTFVRCFDNQNK